MASEGNSTKELQSESLLDGDISILCKDDKIYCIVKDMMDSSIGLNRLIALKKYRNVGERLYQDACQLDLNINSFEANIRRPYFHVRPLDASQLQNWHHYLDFVELQGDFDWAVKLYERCLIVCANYPEYWMRYVDFMETKGGREIAKYSLERATEIFLKRVPAIHLFNARFKEQIGDVLAARAAYMHSGAKTDSDFVENVISKANMEKRLGNMEAAFNIYKEALELAAAEEEKLHALPILYVHFSRLKYMSTNSMDAARDVLIDGIRNLPQSKLLLEELIKFSMVHGGPKHIDLIDPIVADAISPRPDGSQGLSAKDAEDISNLYLEFVDYCGTVHDLRKAWNRHIKLFPDTFRTDIHQQSAKCRSINLIKEKGEETSVAIPHQLCGDSNSDLHAYLPSQDKKVSSVKDILSDAANAGVPLQESDNTQPDDAVRSELQFMEADDNEQEKGRELPLVVLEEPRDNDAEENLSSADLLAAKEVPTDASKNFRKKFSEPNASSENLVHQIASKKESLQAYSKENDSYAQGKYGVESEEVKPLSLESLSLKPQESTCPDAVPMTSHECESVPEICKSNGRPVSSGCNANQDNSASAQDSDSAQTQIDINSPSSASHHDQVARRPLQQARFSRNGSGNWHQMSNASKFRRGPKFGHRGHGHRKQYQQQHPSPQKHHPAEGGVQMPKTSDHPFQPALLIQQGSQGQSQLQTTATPDFVAAHSWPMQNVLLQNSTSQSQPPTKHTISQVSQHAMQDHGQYGHMQNAQAYNQMWQYYYYQQQQQQFLLQQQQQQHLQPQQPQLLQQQYQQQLQLQQHYMQYQQHSFQQEQSQQFQQQNQPQQLQFQQEVLMQHQQQHLQQHHIQQQRPLQQELPVSPLPLQPTTQVQQKEQEQKQYNQLTASPHSQSLDYGHYQQGQGATLLQHSGEIGLVSSSVSPHPQEKSPQAE